MPVLAVGQANQPPSVKIIKPAQAPYLETGKTIAYEIEVEDAEDGYSIYEEIEPFKVFLELRILNSREAARQVSAAPESPAIALVKANDCLTCHRIRNRFMGPSFQEIAEKHAGDTAPMIKSIQNGSQGQWGNTAIMPPHETLTEEQVKALAGWIADLNDSETYELMAGTSGIIQVDPSLGGKVLWIQASYLDMGGEATDPIQGTADRIYPLR